MKVLFSNIGYAKGIDGSLQAHLRHFHRHIYAGVPAQRRVIAALKEIIDFHEPEVCCFVEVDSGSFHSARLNHIQEMIDERYQYHDISSKYGENSPLGRMPLHRGKSNGFLARIPVSYQKFYLESGSKRLIYHLPLPGDINLIFAHFSLNRHTRLRQFAELQALMDRMDGEFIILADFNIFEGFSELRYLLDNTGLKVMSEEDQYTFAFHNRQMALDLCLCSPSLADNLTLTVIDQPFSDHDALLVELVS